MKKPEIAKSMAMESGDSPGEAADRLDLLVHEILDSIRLGETAPLPGLGSFSQAADGRIHFDRYRKRRKSAP